MPTTTAANQTAAILFLHAQTGLHPGSGTALGVVDLPVQRERHTQWPVIPGSAIKGVLRDACRRPLARQGVDEPDADERIAVPFGPSTREPDKHAGALSVTDARILLFPVRSLRGVFAWVTCPAVLERLSRDLGMAGLDAGLGAISHFDNRDEVAYCAADSPLLIQGENKLVLEEMEFSRELEEMEFSREGDLPAAAWLAERAVSDEPTQKRMRDHLVVISDNDFGHFVRHATEIVARIGLDYQRKTVRDGALFYQEFLPAETVFYTVILANCSRREGHQKSGQAILGDLQENVMAGSVLQIGGDETTGKGFCTVTWLEKTEA